MLVIRDQQRAHFKRTMFDHFVDQCTSYVRESHAVFAARFDDPAALRAFIQDSLKSWRTLGFHDRGHLRQLLDWECAFGPRFSDTEPWSWLREIVHSQMPPESRLFRIENRLRLLRENGDL